jgi:hypothetical protein
LLLTRPCPTHLFCPPPRQDKFYWHTKAPLTLRAHKRKLIFNLPYGWPLVAAVETIRRVLYGLMHDSQRKLLSIDIYVQEAVRHML